MEPPQSLLLARRGPSRPGAGSRPGYCGKGDVATLPGLALFLDLAGIVALSAGAALSRHWERRSDRFALEMTDDPAAFISAMRKLAEQNLADPDPPAPIEALLYDHPSIRNRITMALEYQAMREEQRATRNE
ncbi:MAG: M48 family metalloprotease [Armatimonadetes bacterium]|nr:M48 family metalloprotease [Armatimonadota bacterium]